MYIVQLFINYYYLQKYITIHKRKLFIYHTLREHHTIESELNKLSEI